MVSDISTVTSIKYLTNLNISKNKIKSLECFNKEGELEFLEELNVSENLLTKLEPIKLKNLKKLNLNKN